MNQKNFRDLLDHAPMSDIVLRRSELRLDIVAAFGGYLIIEGQCSSSDAVAAVSVRLPNACFARAIPIVHGSRRIQRGQNGESDAIGFILKAAYQEVVELRPLQRNLCWTVETEAGSKSQLAARARPMYLPDGNADPLARWAIMRAIEAGLISDDKAALARFEFAHSDKLPSVGARVETFVRSGEALLIELWAANAGKRNLVAFSPDLMDVAAGDELMFLPRPELNDAIAKSGCVVETDQHGVLVSLKGKFCANNGATLAEITDNKIVAIQKIETTPMAPSQDLFERIVSVAGNGRLPSPEIAERFIRPMISAAAPDLEFQSHLISGADASPEISIIVALAGDVRSIQSFIAMQLKSPPSLEWIMVCDDPSLHGDLLAQLQSRRGVLRGRTLLVCNKNSYGYARANMIGAKVARGRMLLFMAADVWIDDFSVFNTGVAAIDSGAYGAVGFRLYHEDGTLLHDGLRFQKSAAAYDLLLSDCPGQGLPPKNDDSSIVSVPAATNALLLISRGIFDEIGGFDDSYIIHEYEDLDLCLKINRLARKQVGLIRDRGCYRLIQKEAAAIGEMSLAGIVVYLNCINFNRKWGSTIANEINNKEWFR
ncbi:MAG: hypothetical protein P4M15_07245 [Alphaproteobacteria bacterium]|nr:hypothetical protein [Alphaproteobacteria bacterium]